MAKLFVNLFLRHAIVDMVVRGAPAIAIAAALSLAVEVANLQDFVGTSDVAASFLNNKLDYLVTRYFVLMYLMHCLILKFSFFLIFKQTIEYEFITFLTIIEQLLTQRISIIYLPFQPTYCCESFRCCN